MIAAQRTAPRRRPAVAPAPARSHARLRALLVALAAIILALTSSPLRAQEIYGPPAVAPRPATPAQSPIGIDALADPSAPEFGETPFNPLAMLDAAGRAIEARQGNRPAADDPDASPGGISTAMNILVVLTVISLAPSIMLMTTCFVRIVVVLGLLKQAIGTQQLPPPQVTVGLALFMTAIVMMPTLDRVHREAILPYRNGEIRDYDELWDRAKQPLRDFMFEQIDATDNWSSVYMILQHRGVDVSDPSKLTRADVDMVSLIPAYMLSELKTAFLMGFRVYLPFLVIDMVISSLLISMSMMMLPPVLISLPFKLLLFVLVDGWQLVVGSLMSSFNTGPPSVIASITHFISTGVVVT